MECEGLGDDWEENGLLRQQIRTSGGRLLTHPPTQKFCLADRANCKANREILKPVLARMARTVGMKLPPLDPLKRELKVLSTKLGLVNQEKAVYQPAVELKRLCGFVKRRVVRKEPTKDQCWELGVYAILSFVVCVFWVSLHPGGLGWH